MGIFRQFPYTNFHELNLNWILKMMKELELKWEDFTVNWSSEVQDKVDNWLNEHPEATTTVQDGSLTEEKFTDELKIQTIKDYVTPEMYGAVGDGVTNDYKAFLDCAIDAHLNDKTIVVPNKTYYLDGADYPVIELFSNVKCLGSVFIVGDSHFRTYKPVFAYVHDNEVSHVNGVFANFIINNNTVADAYADKFFILDTLFAYGTSIAPEAPDDETLKECIYTSGTKTNIYFTPNVAQYLNNNAAALHISDMNETGYSFSGAVIRQKTNNGYGICFMHINRNNIHIDDIQINCDNELGEGTVFNCEYANNITFTNITSFSKQPNSWTYEIACYYCANVLVDNFKGFNTWSGVATRGLKNYTLKNSITQTYDCHWNAFGMFICENNKLFGSAHLGVGCGMFIVKNTKCTLINTRVDYVMTWYGDIIIEDCYTDRGMQMYIADDTTSGYDPFFATFKLPSIKMRNVVFTERPLYARIPNNTAARITPYSWLSIENMKLDNVSIPFNNVKYKAFVTNVPLATGSRSTLAQLADILIDEGVALPNVIDVSSDFTNSYCEFRKYGLVGTLKFTGFTTRRYASGETLFTLAESMRPSHAPTYFVGMYGDTPLALFINAAGEVKTVQATTSTGSRLSFNVSWINTSVGTID